MDSVDNLEPETLNGLNLYAYCGNNPVMRIDPNGNLWFLIPIFIALAASTVVGGVVGGVTASMNGGSFWEGFAYGALSGVLIAGGALLMPFMPHLGATMVGFGVGSLAGGAFNLANGGSYSAGWLGGGVNGGLNALGTSLGMPTLGGFLGGFFGSAITQRIDKGSVDLGVALMNGIINAALNKAARFPAMSAFANSLYFSTVGSISSALNELLWYLIQPFKFW